MQEAMAGFRDGAIQDLKLELLSRRKFGAVEVHELFRLDELDHLPGLPGEATPQMVVASRLSSGTACGPVQHLEQTNIFVFLYSAFRVHAWDMRRSSSTLGTRESFLSPAGEISRLVLPPGIVYTLLAVDDGTLLNFPTRLLDGYDRKDVRDEIHYEAQDHPFRIS